MASTILSTPTPSSSSFPSSDPTADDAIALFHTLEARFPSANLGPDRWYILAIATLTASPHPHLAATLYTYLTSQPNYQTATSRQALMRRLREALVKSVGIVGVCRPLEAVFCIAEVEREEDRDFSSSREQWQCDEETRARGAAWLDTIYKHNRTGTIKALEAHKDFAWISQNITYGLYLSDHRILDAIDTELIVLSEIMMQNLARETGWHLRGMRRVGVAREDVEGVAGCIELVAQFAGVRVDRVPKVGDIEHEV